MPKTKQLKNLRQTHGELVDVKPTNLDMLLGYRGTSKYSFLSDPFNDSEYESYLKNLDHSSLAEHCQSFGIIHTDNKPMTIKKLLAEFRLHRSTYSPHSPKFVEPQNQTLEQIMAAGK